LNWSAQNESKQKTKRIPNSQFKEAVLDILNNENWSKKYFFESILEHLSIEIYTYDWQFNGLTI